MLPGQVPVDPNQQGVEEAEEAVAEAVEGQAREEEEEEEETLMAVTEAAEVTAVSPIGVETARSRYLRLQVQL